MKIQLFHQKKKYKNKKQKHNKNPWNKKLKTTKRKTWTYGSPLEDIMGRLSWELMQTSSLNLSISKKDIEKKKNR